MAGLHELPQVAFLVGSVRSGTTLFRLMLTTSANVAWFTECDFLFDAMKNGGARPSASEFITFFELDRTFLDSGVKPDFSSGDYDDAIRSCLAQICKPETNIVGGNLHHSFANSQLVFPKAKFIFMIRDPRDVARSAVNIGFVGTAYSGTQYWVQSILEWEKLQARLDPSQWIVIRFEDFIRDPEQYIKRACTFLGISYDPLMLEVHQRSTYERPSAARGDAWKSEASAFEVRSIESVTFPWMKKYGYEPVSKEHSPLPFIMKTALLAQDHWIRKRRNISNMGLIAYLMNVVLPRLIPLKSIRTRSALWKHEFERARLK